METKITTRQIAGWLRRGLTVKDIGWEIIGQTIDEAQERGERAERIAYNAWENGMDYRLGFEAIDLMREAVSRRKHLRATFTLERLSADDAHLVSIAKSCGQDRVHR